MKINVSIVAILLALALSPQAFSQVTIAVDASVTPTPISKYIYGRNNSLSGNPGSSFVPNWDVYKDAGLNFLRESGGNNSTKYNWKKKISSHPDWYNNVYTNDWDYAVTALQKNMPAAQGMWAFQLLGKVAKTSAANFNDYAYNGSQWWEGVNQNLAGGGTVNETGKNANKAATEGNINLYLQDWTPDSTTAIIQHWVNDLKLNKDYFRYWNMDNEVEIWNGTHDDVMPNQITAEEFMQRYFAVAKLARERYPNIKLVGPVTANEWQWYMWNGALVTSGGKKYPWLEYFIKRVAEEQAATGVRLLDVLDVHFYPGSSDITQVVQMHRVYFDKTYNFPEANGVKNISGSYDNTMTKEYIFERCKAWLDTYLGTNHGVTFGVTETGVNITNPNGIAVWYAGMLGEFMKHPEMEIFTPWSWSTGMWETLHLSSRFNKPFYIPATSSNENLVSAYPSINATHDSLTVMVVNRSTTAAQTVNLSFKGYTLANADFDMLKLSALPSTETFVSHKTNALQKTKVTPKANTISISMPALSVASILLKGQLGQVVTATEKELLADVLRVFPNPAVHTTDVNLVVNKPGNALIEVIDQSGRVIKSVYRGRIADVPFKKSVDLSAAAAGLYFMRLILDEKTIVRKVVLN